MGSSESNPYDDWASEIEVAPINLNKRLPAVLLLDTSSSMQGESINALNAGLKVLEEEFDPETGDPKAIRSIELAIVTFGAGGVQTINLASGQSATSLQNTFVEAADFRAPVLTTGGSTPMGPAMDRALTLLNERKRYYKEQSIPYFRPWIFLISDGEPDPGWESSAANAVQAESGNHVTVFPIGVRNANLEKLSKFSNRSALKLDGLKFRELFLFISGSMSAASVPDPNATRAYITPDAIATWAQIDLSHG